MKNTTLFKAKIAEIDINLVNDQFIEKANPFIYA